MRRRHGRDLGAAFCCDAALEDSAHDDGMWLVMNPRWWPPRTCSRGMMLMSRRAGQLAGAAGPADGLSPIACGSCDARPSRARRADLHLPSGPKPQARTGKRRIVAAATPRALERTPLLRVASRPRNTLCVPVSGLSQLCGALNATRLQPLHTQIVVLTAPHIAARTGTRAVSLYAAPARRAVPAVTAASARHAFAPAQHHSRLHACIRVDEAHWSSHRCSQPRSSRRGAERAPRQRSSEEMAGQRPHHAAHESTTIAALFEGRGEGCVGALDDGCPGICALPGVARGAGSVHAAAKHAGDVRGLPGARHGIWQRRHGAGRDRRVALARRVGHGRESSGDRSASAPFGRRL